MIKSKRCSRSRGIALSWLAASLLLLSPQLSAQGKVYQYRDDSGRRVFVDRLSAIPLKYRSQLEIREDRPMSAAQIAEMQREQEIAALQRALQQVERLLNERATPVTTDNHRVLVPISISRGNKQRTLSLLLDTGANTTVIHQSALRGIAEVGMPVGQANVADGSVVDLYSVNLDRVQIGPFEITPARAQVIEYRGSSDHQGLLGMDLLSQIDYRIDFAARQLLWAPERFAELQAQRERLLAALDRLQSPAAVVSAAKQSGSTVTDR